MVGKRPGGPILARSDQVPDETLDVFISTVMQQTVGQQGSADGFHIRLLQRALEAAVSQNVAPPSPAGDIEGKQERWHSVRVCVYPTFSKATFNRPYWFELVVDRSGKTLI